MPNLSGTLYPSGALFPGASGPFTEGISSSLAPWNDPGGNWFNLNQALAAMFEQVYSIVADFGSPDIPASYTPGWSVLLDPVNCPTQFLPYLATFVGVTVPPNTPDAVARSLILAEAGQKRGTPASIVAAAKRYLTGSQSCILLERSGGTGTQPNGQLGSSAYSFQLVVRPEQLLDATGLTNAVNAVKPSGITWQLIATDGEIWNQAARTWSSDTTTWAAKG